jgi:hypothetical protein
MIGYLTKHGINPIWCFDVISTLILTTFNNDPNVVTSEAYNPKMFRPHDTKTQKWTDCLSTWNRDTATPKIGCGVTVEHYVPLVFITPTVYDTTSSIPPRFPHSSPWILGSWHFFHYLDCWKFFCATWIDFFGIFLGPGNGQSYPTEVYQPTPPPKDQCAVCPNLS